MKTVWTQHLKDPKAAQDFIQALKSSTLLRDRLLTILSDKYDIVERKGFREEDYLEANNLHELQAFRNGKLATLREIADLLDFSERE